MEDARLDAEQDARHVFELVTSMLGQAFTLEQLFTFISATRARPLRFMEHTFRPGVSGCCLAFEDSDVIVVRPDLSELRDLVTRLHECAHYLLKHIKPLSMPFDEAQVILNLEKALYRYDMTREQDDAAELLAALLMECVLRHDATIPEQVRRVYGYE